MAWIFCWRFVLGIGIGGDYPISAAIVSERTHLQRRGKLLGWIFSNQGWVSHCTLLAYEVMEVMHGCWEYTRFDACVGCSVEMRAIFSKELITTGITSSPFPRALFGRLLMD